MLNKELVKKKFIKSISTYSDNAKIQLEIAKKLSCFITGKYNNVLEIGSYSGFLTKNVIQNIEFDNYLALDIVDSFDFIKNLNPKIKFLIADIETIQLKELYDLIISSSSLQWCENLDAVVKKLKSYLKKDGRIIISIFGEKNLYQIKETFGISLNYPDILSVKKMFSAKAKIFEETYTLEFDSSKDILKHLKYTGVNSLGYDISYSQIKEKLKILDLKYQNKLTYNPIYIID